VARRRTCRWDADVTKKHGTARVRGLAAELKELREKAGLNTRDAARRVGMSPATLNRMELGNRAIEVEDMAALLAIYGVIGTAKERLLARTREAGLPGWWETTGTGLPKEVPALINFESEATRIVHVAMLRIPGLMQVPGYIRAIMASRESRARASRPWSPPGSAAKPSSAAHTRRTTSRSSTRRLSTDRSGPAGSWPNSSGT
jgi:transcriptional regulator with XRE-family HTH domain